MSSLLYVDYRDRLRQNRDELVRDLDANQVVDHLVAEGVFDLDEEEAIRAPTTRRARVTELLKRLPGKGAIAFTHFVNALEDPFPDLREALLCDVVVTEEDRQQYIKRILLAGAVPPRPEYFADRPAEVTKVREALRELQASDGWVVVHGMGGSGKTLLAAEALRDDVMLKDCFPDGVYWLTIGQLTENGQVDSAKLLMKMQNLCARLETDISADRPSNIEAAHDRLMKIFSTDYNNALLVLDDVWSQVVARAFSVRCRCLVTSRFAGVANQTRAPFKLEVPLTAGFTQEQTLIVFSHLTGIPVKELPPDAKGIHHECQGLPLAVAMLGALLKPDPKPMRWHYFLSNLRDKKLSIFTAGNENQSLSASIAISVEALAQSNPEIYHNYKMFAIFDDDPVLSSQVLAVLWGIESPVAVEIKMDTVLEMSLAHKIPVSQVLGRLKSLNLRPAFRRSGSASGTAALSVNNSRKESEEVFSVVTDRHGRQRSLSVSQFDYAHYSLHDLQLDYLKDELVSEEEKLLIHKRLVDGYSKLCAEQFHELPDDGYIHRHLGFHMLEAEESARLCALLTDLRWIEKKLLYSGIDDLLNDYLRFMEHAKRAEQQVAPAKVVAVPVRRRPGRPARAKSPAKPLSRLSSVDPKVLDDVKAYQRFISIHAHHLLDESRVSILQLALSLPQTNIVYQQALRLAKQETLEQSAFYVRLCNASEDVRSHMLTVRLHAESVSSVHCSPDSLLCVSCSDDLSVRIWNRETGSLVATMEGHDNYVKQCCFNPRNSSQVISCSEDETVRVWSCDNDRLGTAEQILEYRSADCPINCCCVDPTGELCAIGDLDGNLRVFSLVTGQDILVVENAHPEEIKCCAWSSSKQFIATASADMTAKLWSAESGALLASFTQHKLMVYGCAFSSRSDRLITCSHDQTLKVWSMSTKEDKSVATMAKDAVAVMCCAFSTDDKFIVSGSYSGTIRVWNGISYEHLYSLDAHTGWVKSVCFVPNHQSFFSCSSDTTCKRWELSVTGHKDCVHYDRRLNLHVDMDSGVLTTACLDKSNNKLQILRGECLDVVEEHSFDGEKTMKSFALSRDLKLLAYVSTDGDLKIVETSPSTQLPQADGASSSALPLSKDGGTTSDTVVLCENTLVHSTLVRIIRFSPELDYVVSASDDGVQAVWHLDGSNTKLHFSMAGNMAARHVPFVFFKNRPWLLSSDLAGNLQVRNLEDGSQVASWSSGAEHQPLTLAVSFDDRYITAAVGHNLMVWSTDNFLSGKPTLVKELEGHSDVIRSCAFSPDGYRLASGSDDRTIQLWDADFALVERMKVPHSMSWTVDMVFSAASDLLVSISDRIKFWLAEDGTLVRTVHLNGAFTKFIRADPDFTSFATVDDQGTLYLLGTVFPDEDEESA